MICVNGSRTLLENKNEQGDTGYVLQGEDTVKLIKSHRLGWYGHIERMKNQRMRKKLQELQWKEQGKEDVEED